MGTKFRTQKRFGKRAGIAGLALMAMIGLTLGGFGRAAHAQTPTTTRAVQSIQWGDCAPPPDGLPDGGQQCGTIAVPLDYASPGGKQISVAVSRISAAKPSERRGALLLNPGGPGGSGLDLPRVFTILFPQSVLDHYDLIGFDPRFVGQSTPVSCGMTQNEAIQAFVPLTQPGGFDATASYMKNIAQKCSATSGPMLPYATTANTARDMDQIRQALGESRISYFAYSYGTYLGAVYASMFPNQTDRFVLDSSVDPQWVWRDQFRSWGPGGEQRFPDFATFAAANDSTYHLGNSPSQINDLFFKLVNALSKHPVTLPDGTVLNDTMFRELTFSALYDDANFPLAAQTWQLANGQVSSANTTASKAVHSLLATPAATSVPQDNAAASGLAILCDDASWPRSPLTYQLGLAADSSLFPKFGQLGSNIWPCAFWQNQPKEQPVTITSNGPRNILMVQDQRDPATPIWGALQLRSDLGRRAGLVTVDQGGHAAAYLKPNICANDDTTDFLVNGTLPTGDRYCPANPQTMMPFGANNSTSSAQHQAAVQTLLKQMHL